MIELDKWKDYLDTLDISDNTKIAYYDALKNFSQYYDSTENVNLKAYKSDIMETHKVSTVNLRLIAVNKYNRWIGHPEWHIKGLRTTKKTFIDNVISKPDFIYLCREVKKVDTEMYFLIRFMGCTGARISEVLKFKAESLHIGYVDILTKGNKLRRIYIPKNLRKEALSWKSSGLLFTYPTYKIRNLLKKYSYEYRIDVKSLHPHSFRHFFALSFIEKFKDLALLSDLLGHDSIETTRIYLRRTSAQQARIVDNVVNW